MAISTIGQNGLTVPLTTSGSLGIGTASPTSPLQVNTAGVNTTVQINSTDANGGYGANIALNNTGTGGRQYALFSTSNADGDVGGGKLKFYDLTASATRMLIDSSGNLLVGVTSLSTADRLNVTKSTSGNKVFHCENTANTSGDELVRLRLGTNCNNTTSYHIVCSTGNDKMYVYGNGNIVNANNSYGALSDQSIKENIVDATPKLADLMQVKVRNFNLIEDEYKVKQIGVVAQELEEVFPSMVELDGISGKKQVKYSVFVPMLIKSIQELKAINDQQAETINALTARIVALEAK